MGPRHGHELDRVGDASRAAGVVALVTLLVPGIGELVAVPAAVLAITLGLLGIRRYETGRAASPGPAAVGTFLGMGAGLIAVLLWVMARA